MPTHGVGMVAAVRNQSIRINGRDVLCNFTAELVINGAFAIMSVRREGHANSEGKVSSCPRHAWAWHPGAALLPGLLVCGACGRRMHAGYRSKAKPYYKCMRRKLEGSDCCGLGAASVDDLVSEQLLLALRRLP